MDLVIRNGRLDRTGQPVVFPLKNYGVQVGAEANLIILDAKSAVFPRSLSKVVHKETSIISDS